MSRAKQAFYENHAGGSIGEINTITIIILLGHIAHQACIASGLIKNTSDDFLWSFLCYFLNVLLAITVYSDKHYVLVLLYGSLIVVASAKAWLSRTPGLVNKKPKESVTTGKQDIAQKPGRVMYVSVFRATMMITTVLAILAVDLPIFPRRYAKSETWGTSMMDLGVGSFVFSSGLVSSNLNVGFLGGIKQAGILGLMGFGRALMVRGTGYHEHVSEYGAHWNFFITLSLLPPLLPVFRRMKSLGISWLSQGLIICITQQLLLLSTKWQAWIIAAERTSFISANKEGLSSLPGYISIYLFGLDVGSLAMARKPRPVLPLLFVSFISFWAAYLFVSRYFAIRVSRRIANSPYILWVAAHNTTFLFALAAIEQGCRTLTGISMKCAKLLDKINARGLYVFLGSNLLTGSINLLIGDAMMTTSTYTGLAIMLFYSITIATVAYNS